MLNFKKKYFIIILFFILFFLNSCKDYVFDNPYEIEIKLYSPSNITIYDDNCILSWEEVNDADYYIIEMSKNPNFTNLVVNISNIKTTTYQIENLDNLATYYWRIKAKIGNRIYSSKSNSFITDFNSELSFPLNNAAIKGNTVLFSWKKVKGAIKYTLQLSKDPNFTNPFNINNITTNSFEVGNIENNSTFYWRIKTYFDNNTSKYSKDRSFKTNYNLAELSYPGNNVNILGNTVLFSWKPFQGATKYTLQLSKDPNFTNPFNIDNITTNSFEVGNIENNSTLYWRIKAYFDNYTSIYSESRSFKATQITSSLKNTKFSSDGLTALVVGNDNIYKIFNNNNLYLTSQYNTSYITSIAFANASTAIAVGVYGTIIRSTNGGLTWQNIT
ncbi:MAG TPA: fibronectin type III domain-containing protein, partial [Ignavibacteriales bacterium]|nr:fibronectin type III domain-containing protein [Ignavibacteriales bacterium]